MKYEVEVTKYNTIWRNPETKQLHRLDGPAIEYSHGYKEWYIEGKRHRLNGPAIEYSDGSKEWWVEGKCHRTDGPACEYGNGDKEWYVDGQEYSETNFNNLFSKTKANLSTKAKPCSGKVVIVDGIEYTLS